MMNIIIIVVFITIVKITNTNTQAHIHNVFGGVNNTLDNTNAIEEAAEADAEKDEDEDDRARAIFNTIMAKGRRTLVSRPTTQQGGHNSLTEHLTDYWRTPSR